jgi:DNA polymerase (family 10)
MTMLRDLTTRGVAPEYLAQLQRTYRFRDLDGLYALLAKRVIPDDDLLRLAHVVRRDSRLEPLPFAVIHSRAVLEMLLDKSHELGEGGKVAYVGEVRRGVEAVRSIEFLVGTKRSKKFCEPHEAFEGEWVTFGPRSMTFSLLGLNVPIHVYFVHPESWGTALVYHTGSREYYRALQRKFRGRCNRYFENERLVRRGVYLGSDGLWKIDDEQAFYTLFDLAYRPPYLREGSSLNSTSPDTLRNGNVKADFHVHSKYSDGLSHIRELMEAAKQRGYSHLGISDYYRSGMCVADAKQYFDAIKATGRLVGIHTLVGLEAAINMVGEVECPKTVMAVVDYIIASISDFPGKRVAARITKAISYHPKVQIIGHPSGRWFGKSDPAETDWRRLFRTFADKRIAFEINGQPQRLDLPERLIKIGVEEGVTFALGSNARHADQLANMQWAVNLAQRCEVPGDRVLNTRFKER